MRTWIITAITMIILLPAVSALAENSITIDSVVTFTNQTGKVPVTFTNDVDLAGIEMSVWWDLPEVQIDSFSFADGRVEFATLKGSLVMGDTVSIYAIPFSGEPLITPGTGLFGHLHFSYSLDIIPQVMTIDTVTVIVPPDVDYSTRFMEPSKGFFTPDFILGYLDIQQAFGCCVEVRGDVDNDGGLDANIADLTYLVAYLFTGGAPPDCPEEADLDAQEGPDANIADLTYLVSYLFTGGPAPLPCTP
ncbi:MAG: hypothetical protein KOO62_11240 [candidate division Zixibacteria bacterium]|nr:hypothetical protein [candidate division Zixibacteria bacterium]